MAEVREQPLPAEADHGGIDGAEIARYGWTADQVVDFSSNILPYGPSPSVRAAVREAAIDRYPDRECRQLRAAIAERHAVDETRIVVGNGSSELIHAIAPVLLQSADEALIVGPTFSEYRRAVQLTGATVHECRARADNQFRVPIDDVEGWLERHPPKLAFLCNPNNPTGTFLDQQIILRWIGRNRRTTFVVDESYLEFTGRSDSLLRRDLPNLIVLRSMTKAYAMAGLRLGYAAASEEVISSLRSRRIPWNVSTPAQVAGIAAIRDRAYYDRCLRELRRVKRRFNDELINCGIEPVPSEANFFLLPVRDASAARRHLLAEGVVVRHCGSFGLEDHLRVAVRTPDENRQLADALTRGSLP